MPYWHRSLDAQAWTDLVSNITSLTPSTVDDDPRSWLGWGQAKAEQLSVFLHEATHHWCFTSPVAFAIAGLTLRARLGMVRMIHGERDLEDSVISDLISADTAVALLRPLAEGLALFAEFDATTRIHSKAISPVLQSLFQFFIDPQRHVSVYQRLPGEIAIAANIGEVLYDLRTDPATLDRKASLFLKPFSLDAGGYLPGYLAVKSLWRAASRRHFLLANETDSFLMYLRSYLYDDWGLVATLLSPGSEPIRSAENVVNYLNGRINQWNELTEEDFSEYENSVAVNRGSGPLVLHGIRVEDGVVESSRIRLNDLINELVASSKADESITSTIAAWSTSVLQRRQFMNLTSVPIELCGTADGLPEVRWQGISLFKPKSSEFTAAPDDLIGEAQLEVVFSLRDDRFERAAVVHRANKVLICTTFGLDSDAEDTRVNILRAFLERSRVIEAEEGMRATVDQIVKTSWFQVAVDHWKSQLDAVIDEFFKDVSLRFARDYDAVDYCAASMSQRGLQPILKKSSVIKGLALLGLATSLNPAESFVKDVFEKRGISLTQTLAELNEAYESIGYPPQVYASDQLFTTV